MNYQYKTSQFWLLIKRFLQNSDMNIVLLVNVHGQQYFIVTQS